MFTATTAMTFGPPTTRDPLMIKGRMNVPVQLVSNPNIITTSPSSHQQQQTNMPSPSISLLLALLLVSSPATAFPCRFAPSSLVTGKSIPDEEALRMTPHDGLAWNKDKKSPSIILCSGKSFAGPCQLISENDFNFCINLNDTAEVGSVKFSDGAMCAVYE